MIDFATILLEEDARGVVGSWPGQIALARAGRLQMVNQCSPDPHNPNERCFARPAAVVPNLERPRGYAIGFHLQSRKASYGPGLRRRNW